MAVIKIDKLEWYEDNKWMREIDIYLEAIEDDDDIVIVFDGQERSGKSKRMRQVAKYCANKLGTKFTPDNIHFELQEYLDFSIRSPEGTVCILDEGRNVLNKKSSMSRSNKKFTNYISECAKKRQVHLIAIPAYHDLDSYIVRWRMKFVIHLHKWFDKSDKKKSGYALKRGQYTAYSNNDKTKHKYNFPYEYPDQYALTGKFNNVEVFTSQQMKIYEQKKDDGMEHKYHSDYEDKKKDDIWKVRFLDTIKYIKENPHAKRKEIAESIGMTTNNLRQALHQENVKS